ncbi:hypothetical protein F3Y22_tig00110186pilonHSYRG00147 [Hibiscus syriacus]|uniref:Uncharacterized protein n=1 Tax=Hibiscus syriacus TaxID=106335 RepID=A0A6A3BGF6_HIBSY|nr:hypothetical protein F3Y22_tig00110186pilonHSYRG00147 [Hibiscus syriacus]
MSCSQARRSSDLVSNRDERRWVINIRTFLDDEEDGEGTEGGSGLVTTSTWTSRMKTLAWMMAVNGSFLLEFLRIHVCREDQVSMTMSKLNHDSILRDVVMLENQIPLFVLRKVLEIQYSSSETADDIMLSMLKGFSGELSPFKTMETIDVSKCHHILDFLYQMIVPNLEQIPSEDSEQVVELEEQKEHTDEKKALVTGTSCDRDMDDAFENDSVAQTKRSQSHPYLTSRKPVSVSSRRTETSRRSVSMSRPSHYTSRSSPDNNTDVVLRNLVAYEASYAIGPLVFARYTELINGIIDTEEDVSPSDNQSPVVDKVIEDVNKYHTGTWKVKLNNVLKHYVYRSWRFLTLLAAVVLLFLSTFEVFCSVMAALESRLYEIQTSSVD